MKPERHREVERLYQAALERAPDEREAFLEQACGSDEALRRKVASLLGYDAQAAGFIETPPADIAAAALSLIIALQRSGGRGPGPSPPTHALGTDPDNAAGETFQQNPATVFLHYAELGIASRPLGGEPRN